MKRFFLHGLSALLLGLMLFHAFGFQYLQFSSRELHEQYYFLFFPLLLTILLLIAISLPKDFGGQVGRVLILVGMIVFTFCWLVVFLAGGPTFKIYNKVLYTHKTDPNKQVIERVYYTGIAQSNAYFDTVLQTYITTKVSWVRPINATIISTADWNSVAEAAANTNLPK